MSEVLPEQERRNCQSEFKCGSQDMVGPMSVQEGTRAIQRSEPLHWWIEPEHIHTLGMRNDGRHGGEEAVAVAQVKGKGENVFGGY